MSRDFTDIGDMALVSFLSLDPSLTFFSTSSFAALDTYCILVYFWVSLSTLFKSMHLSVRFCRDSA